jgi:hypothetical protein
VAAKPKRPPARRPATSRASAATVGDGADRESALLERVRRAVARKRGIREQRMFGGSCFLVNGNMACGVTKSGVDLMVRVGPDAHTHALSRKHARPMDITGRPMKGFVFVDAAGSRTQAQVTNWVERGLDYARSLPAKGRRGARPE